MKCREISAGGCCFTAEGQHELPPKFVSMLVGVVGGGKTFSREWRVTFSTVESRLSDDSILSNCHRPMEPRVASLGAGLEPSPDEG